MLLSYLNFDYQMPIVSGTLAKLERFRALKPGWHYGRGGPISDSVLERATDLFYFLIMIGFTRTDAFAGPEGEALITAYYGHHYISITIEPTLRMSLAHELNAAECCEIEADNIFEIRGHLLKVAKEIWENIYVSFTRTILITTSQNLMTWPLRSPPMGECLSLR
jgi:hypothetical protein